MRYNTEPDAATDDALSAQPEPERCETCGEDCDGSQPFVRTSGGTFAFCSETCFREFIKALENA